METLKERNKSYLRAKEKVRNIKIFYMHLVGYIIFVALLSYNLYIVEDGYKDFFIWFNSIFMVSWTIFIAIHAWNVFKGRIFFKKSWEDRKLKEYMDMDQDKKRWE